MKHVASFVAGAVAGALVFGALGLFAGYEFARGGTPALMLRNLTTDDATQLVVHSDRGDSRAVGTLSAGASQRIPLAGGDRLVWLTSTTAGKTLESKHVYIDSSVVYFGAISTDAILLEPVL